jgi:hypothetical protein
MTGQMWRKSSYSTTQGGECVEVAKFGGVVGVRDSKNPAAAHLALDTDSFSALLARIKHDGDGR